MARVRGVYGLQGNDSDPGTYGVQTSEATEKIGAAFTELLAIEQKQTDATKQLIDLEKQRVTGLEASAKAIRDAIKDGQALGDSIKNWTGVLNDALRGNFAGVAQRLAGIFTQSASKSATKLETSAGAGRKAVDVAKAVAGDGGSTKAVGKALKSVPTASAGGGGEAAGAALSGEGAEAAIGGLGAAAAGVALPLAAAAVALKTLIDVSVDLGGKASPIALERFTMAVDDAQAVLGKVFVPVLELVTDSVRLLGDVFATILPSTKEVREALSPLADYLKNLRDVFAAIAPIIKDYFTVSLKALGIALQVATYPLKLFTDALRAVGVIGNAKLNSSVGAAARPASFTNVDSYLKDSYAKAFSLGDQKEENPLVSPLETLVKEVTEIKNAVISYIGKGSVLGTAGNVISTGFYYSPLALAYRAGRRIIQGSD